MSAEYDFTLRETITKIIDMCCNVLNVTISRAAYAKITSDYNIALAGAHARNIPLQWDWEVVVREALVRENKGHEDFVAAASRSMCNENTCQERSREYIHDEIKAREERKIKEKKN